MKISKAEIDYNDQYTKRTVEYSQSLLKEDSELIFHRDGLSVRFTILSSCLIIYLQVKECEVYQLAFQSLGFSLPLHTKVDNTRHEGDGTIVTTLKDQW